VNLDPAVQIDMSIETAFFDCNIFLSLEPDGLYIGSLSYGQMGERV
jgi:hypothetical protein